jgi:hypothetical protein
MDIKDAIRTINSFTGNSLYYRSLICQQQGPLASPAGASPPVKYPEALYNGTLKKGGAAHGGRHF